MSNQEQTPGYKYVEDNTLCYPNDRCYQTSKDKLNMKAGGIKE